MPARGRNSPLGVRVRLDAQIVPSGLKIDETLKRHVREIERERERGGTSVVSGPVATEIYCKSLTNSLPPPCGRSLTIT